MLVQSNDGSGGLRGCSLLFHEWPLLVTLLTKFLINTLRQRPYFFHLLNKFPHIDNTLVLEEYVVFKLKKIQWMEIVGKMLILFAVGVQLTSIADRKAKRVNAEIDVHHTGAYVNITDTPIQMLNTQVRFLGVEAKMLELVSELDQSDRESAIARISNDIAALDARALKLDGLVKKANQKNASAIKNYNSAVDKYRELRLTESWGSKLFPWIFLFGSMLVLSARILEFRSETA